MNSKTVPSSCSKSQFNAIETFVHSRLNCTTAKVFEQEVEFIVPKSENKKFEKFFQELELRKVELNIESHGIKGLFESFFPQNYSEIFLTEQIFKPTKRHP